MSSNSVNNDGVASETLRSGQDAPGTDQAAGRQRPCSRPVCQGRWASSPMARRAGACEIPMRTGENQLESVAGTIILRG